MKAPQAVHEAALRGWSCIPVQSDKRPFFPWKRHQTVAPVAEQLDQWAERYQPEAWAVITGSVSELIVLDFDGRAGIDTLRKLGLKPHVLTPSGGFHWYGTHEGRPIRTLNGKTARELRRRFPGVDIRADGGYAAFFGRILVGEYRSLRAPHPEGLGLLPESLREFLNGAAPAPDFDGAETASGSVDALLDQARIRAEHDGRNNTGFWLACQLRDRGLSPANAHDFLLAYQACVGETNQKGTAEPYTKGEALASVDQAYRRMRHPRSRTERSLPLTDYGNAQRLVSRHGRDLRYAHPWGEWLIWDGRRWLRDATGEVMRRAKDTVRATYGEAAGSADSETRKRLADHARKSEAEPRLRHMVELAKSEPEVAVTPDQLDADPWLLNCLSGTIELKTGQLREHRPEDLITKLAPAEFDPNATDADWDRVVSEACGGSAELEGFLARALGYSITGDTSEEKFFFVHGPSATGKSTVMEVIKAALGDYAVTTDFETFLKRDQAGGPRNDLARLAGARFVSSLEVDHGKRLAEGLVKQMTGGDTVSARFLHREFFEFRPQMKLWLAANHAPRVRSDDDAMWRRIVRIPFEHVIPEEQRDPRLKARLRSSNEARQAILAWLVKGCLAWQEERLSTPPVVRLATAAYREEMDPLRDFIADRCVLGPDAVARSSTLWSEYQAWAKDSGERWALNRKQFGEALRARGFKDRKLRGDRAWHGVGLAPLEPRGAVSSLHRPNRDPERRTDGTDWDTIPDVTSQRPPSRDQNPETDVPSRPAPPPALPDLREWDRR